MPEDKKKAGRAFYSGAIVLLIISAVFLFSNLGDRALWDDEAQTGLMARQILKFGLPMFKEGENIPTDRPDLSDFNEKKVFVWNTWLPYYLTAGSFLLLEESEWSARIPFAVFGALSIVLCFMFGQRLFGRSSLLTLLAVSMLVLSVPFLLHMRQCRYYSLITFGTLWMLWAYLDLLRDFRYSWLWLAMAGIFCFYSFYVIAGLNLAAIWIYSLWKERRKGTIRDLGFASAIITFAVIPAIIYMRLWNLPADGELTLFRVGRSMWVYLLWVNGFILPFALPVIAVLFCKLKKWPFLVSAYVFFLAGAAISGEKFQLLALACLAISLIIFIYHLRTFFDDNVPVNHTSRIEDVEFRRFSGFLAVLVPLYIIVMSVVSPYPFYRYITPLIPLLMLFGAYIARPVFLRSKAVGLTLIVLIMASNLPGALPLKASEAIIGADIKNVQRYSLSPREIWRWTDFRSDMIPFVGELTKHIYDPERALADYLQKHGASGQTVKTSYGDISLMFYLPEMRIVSRWDSNGGIPDYVIKFGPYLLLQNEEFLRKVQGIKYMADEIKAPDVVWSNNPDPLFHLYNMPDSGMPLTVFRKLG